MSAEPDPHTPRRPALYPLPDPAAEKAEHAGMNFWTRFYIGGMGGTLAAVIGSVFCAGILWLAAVLVALCSIPAFWMSRKSKSSGYIAGYWLVIIILATMYALIGPYLHTMMD